MEQTGNAHLKNARTSDYQIGLGYLFDKDCWNLSLAAGYAFDKQKIRTKYGSITFPSPGRPVDAPLYGAGYKTVTTWKGPWVGTKFSIHGVHGD